MYRPNFCSDCGEQIVRLKWRLWTSRRFCDSCAKRLRNVRVKQPAQICLALLIAGFIAGRAGRPGTPPLLIERRGDAESNNRPNQSTTSQGAGAVGGNAETTAAGEEAVYICGARTKKGTPCSRRVHGPVRCWQHKGMRAMLPPEKLLLKDLP